MIKKNNNPKNVESIMRIYLKKSKLNNEPPITDYN